MINRLVVIGLGLIGGSLALAAKQRGLCQTVIGCGRNLNKLLPAIELGIVDQVSADWELAVSQADLVVVASPVDAVEAVFERIAGSIGPDTVVTDVGSTKGSVIAAAERAFGGLPENFVPGHPIAGTEHSGFEHALANLFDDRKVILTPHAGSTPAAIEMVSNLWQAVGSDVVQMDSATHDQVLAVTSHLPHMLVFALMKMVADRDDHQAVFDFAAGGFRDFTRIASSDPEMWRAIALANDKEVIDLLTSYQAQLSELVERLRDGDGDYLQQLFGDAKRARDTHLVKPDE